MKPVEVRRAPASLLDGEGRLVAMAAGLLLATPRYGPTRVWDLDGKAFGEPLPGALLATSPDGRWVAIAARDGHHELLEVRDLTRGAVAWRDQPKTGYRPLRAAFSADSSTVAYSTRNWHWDHGEGFVVRVADGPGAACVRFASEAGQPDVLGVDETGTRVASAEQHTLDVAEVAAARFVTSTRIDEAPRALFIADGAVLVHTFAGALLRWHPDGNDGPRLVAARAVVSPTGRTFSIDTNPDHALWLDFTRVVTSDGEGATVIDTATGTRQLLDLGPFVALLATPQGALVVVS